ncbi:MAG: transglutaminase-like domain-containing protein [Anaerolineaceae bacterium]|nr:transglutaminase-like domain-containing protein [Anaerolineaceae bacterium]
MLKRENKWLDIVAAFLLFAAFWVTALRLDATGWSEDLAQIKTFVLFGFILGYLLGQSVFKRWTVIALSGLYTIIIIPWVLGTTMDAEIVWSERLVSLGGRLSSSSHLFVTNQPIKDYLLFVFSMALLFWFMSLIGGFQLSRSGAPWAPLLIAGIALVSIDTSSPEVLHRGRYSGAFMVFTLLSLGRLYFLGERLRWSRSGIAVDSETGYDLGRSMAIIGLILVLIAWNIPAISGLFNTGAGARFRFSRFRDRLSNLTAGLNVPGYTTSDFSYGNDLKLGTGIPLDAVELFQVQASRNHPTGIPFYWKSQSYDRYVDDGWKNTVTKEHEIVPSEWPVRELSLEHRVEIDLTYRIQAASLQTLYLPEQPQSVSRPAIWVGDSAAENQVDIIAVKAEKALLSGETIKVETRLNDLTVAMLRQAGDDYPKWVLERYLSLPEDFPQSVADLAANLTSGAATPYDEVRVITAYLRNEISYENEIPVPPEDQNLIEWFLFTHKAGFCNYYATSEVLMLRSLGIPARMVVGFAQGEPDEEKANLYHIRMNDYHAWPEIYFPEIGWVQFEPTASQPVHSLRLGLEDELSSESGNDLGLRPSDRELPDRDPFADLEEDPTWNLDGEAAVAPRCLHPAWIVLGVVLVIVASVYAWWRRPPGAFRPAMMLTSLLEKQFKKRGFQTPSWIKRWADQTQLSPMERMFARVPLMLALFGEKSNSGDTAAEQITVLIKYLDSNSRDVVSEFLMLYHTALFSPHPVDFSKARAVYLKLWWIVLTTVVKRWRGV